jgi:hypothetical protein
MTVLVIWIARSLVSTRDFTTAREVIALRSSDTQQINDHLADFADSHAMDGDSATAREVIDLITRYSRKKWLS